MALLIINSDWNCSQYDLSADFILVLAVIARCSQGGDAKGWYSSHQALAQYLQPIRKISRQTVDRAVSRLLELGLIEERDGSLFYAQIEQADAQIEQANAQNVRVNAQIEQNLAPLNNPPINNKIKEEKELLLSRTPSRDEVQEPFIMNSNFSIFMKAFRPSGHIYNRAQCRWLWEDVLPFSVRNQIVADLLALEASNQLTDERNPYFYLLRFAPKTPHDWNSDPSIDQSTSARLVSAWHNDHYGSFTPEDIILFGLPVAPSYQTIWDAYLRTAYLDPAKKPPKYRPRAPSSSPASHVRAT